MNRQYFAKKWEEVNLTKIKTALVLQMELNNKICTKYGYGYVKGIHCRMTEGTNGKDPIGSVLTARITFLLGI